MDMMNFILQRMLNDPRTKSNPMAQNTINMLNNGDSKGLEELATNLCKQRGVNPQDVFNNVMKNK